MTQPRGADGRFASSKGEQPTEISKAPNMNYIMQSDGASGLKRSFGFVYEEFLPVLEGKRGVHVYQEMSDNDPIIGAVFFAIDMFMRGVKWFVDAPGDDDESQKKAQFVRECKDDMAHTWPDFMSEVMSMMRYGWSYFETIYKIRHDDDIDQFGTKASKYNDGKIGWKKFEIRSQDSLDRWEFNDDGEIMGMWQRAAPDYMLRFIPSGKALHFRTKSDKNNPEGRSVLRNAYRPWYFKKRIEEIEGIGIERDLAGLPFAEVPAEMLREDATPDQKATVKAILELVKNVRRDQQEGVVWPQAWGPNGEPRYNFKLMNSGGTRQFSTDQTITRYEQRIAMTVLADFILLGNDSQGSFAMATSKSGLFQSALSAWLDMIQEVLNNYAIPRLFALNNMEGPYPTFRHDQVSKPSLVDLATLVAALAGAGAQLFPDIELENHFRQVAQLPLREATPEDGKQEDELRDQTLQSNIENAKAAIEAAKNPQKFAANPQAAILGKQPGSVPGAPTKTSGAIKSKLPPNSRRNTAGARAAAGVTKSVKIVKKRKPNPAADRETEQIKENAKRPENMKRHPFEPAHWTHPNGHPRCKRCGHEEPIGGICDPRAEM